MREVDGAGAKGERWSWRLAAAFLFPYTWDLWANGNVRLLLPNARLANLLAVFVRAKLSVTERVLVQEEVLVLALIWVRLRSRGRGWGKFTVSCRRLCTLRVEPQPTP